MSVFDRRDVCKFPLAAAALLNAAARKDEYAEDNTKIATMIDVRKATDDDLLFLKQIGLRWVHASFGNEPASYEFIKSAQVSTILGLPPAPKGEFIILSCMVIISVRLCKGCRVALSRLTTGMPAYLINCFI